MTSARLARAAVKVELALLVPEERLPLPPETLRRQVRRAAEEAGFRGKLSLAVVDDRRMRRLNRDFHATDAPTDVLAFPLGEDSGAGRAAGPPGFDAEVIVSLDTARREARARKVEPAAELLFYVVHGILHLQGWDDHDPAEASRMHARAVAILAGLGHHTTIGDTLGAEAPRRADARRARRRGHAS